MRDASQVPRNSRELAVRNQFLTPRYVVEFLVDNTLGRLWFNWTGGQTGLRDRCQYLLVKPDEQPEPTTLLRDPRTIKLLDPACGSMHFGLYAFDLFLEIYREAWAWEQTHGPGCLDTETGGSADLKPLSQTYADQDALAPKLGTAKVGNVTQRMDVLRKKLGDRFQEMPLSDFVRGKPKITPIADLLVLRSTEIDSQLDSNPETALGLIPNTLKLIRVALHKLRGMGFKEALIVTDHGFFLSGHAAAGDVCSKRKKIGL